MNSIAAALLSTVRGIQLLLAKISLNGARAGALLFFFGCFYITFDVLARKFLGFSSRATDEVGGYILAIGMAWVFAYGVVDNRHIRVDTLLMRLPVLIRGLLNWVAYLFLAGSTSYLAYAAFTKALDSMQLSAHSVGALGAPLFIPQLLWAIGISLFALVATVTFARICLDLATGKIRKIAREYAPPGAGGSD